MVDIKKSIGEKIRMNRIKYGWTQEVLAHKVGVQSAYIGQLERGEKNVTLDSLDRIIEVLGITFDKLFEVQVDPSQDVNKELLDKFILQLQKFDEKEQFRILNIINEILDWKEI